MTDRDILRSLAGRVRELAELPVMAERRQLWADHNALRPTRPLLLVSPEGSWAEIIPEAQLQCTDQLLRSWEWSLRSRIYQAEQIQDDSFVEPSFDLGWQIQIGDYGVAIPYTHGTNRGSYVWEAPLKDLTRDLDQLHYRELSVDRAATQRNLAHAAEVFGDLLPVRLQWQPWWTVGLTWEAVKLIGVEEMMLEMYDHPAELHRLMAFLRDEMLHFIGWFEREGLLTPNNTGVNCGSGGLAVADELQPSATATRLRDCWGFAESQETVGVSPQMFGEFILPYQVPLLERFGLNYYGCCEDLAQRLDLLRQQVPRLRRISVAPKADQEAIAGQLAGQYVFCRKADPVPVCVEFNEPNIRADVRRTLQVAHGQPLELILKDTHTVQHEPARLSRWVAIAREEIARAC